MNLAEYCVFVQIFVYLCNVSIEIDESSYYKYL